MSSPKVKIVVVELKETLFKVIIRDFEDKENDIYIICSANSFEMACGEDCIDVGTARHRTFKGYPGYKNYILRKREQKAKRLKGD